MILDEQPADMTAALLGQASSPAEKQALVHKLNFEAKAERTWLLQSEVMRFAAKMWRSRVLVFTSPEAAKSYMETEAGGLQARTVLVDVTMPGCRQTGSASRALCHPPTKELQRTWATAIKLIPATPVIGHVLTRPALHSGRLSTISISPPTSTSGSSPFPSLCRKSTCGIFAQARGAPWAQPTMRRAGLTSS